jgi:hypothetical protein
MTTKRPVSRLALALIAVSLVTGAGTTMLIAREFLQSIDRPVFAVPGSATVDIDEPAKWAVYERTGTRAEGGPVQARGTFGARHGLESITVTGPDGRRVDLDTVTGTETITRGDGDVYTAVAVFRARSTGAYRVEVEGEPAGQAIVAPEVLGQFAKVLPWIGIAVLSGLVLLGACVGLVVSLVRRNRVSA